MRVLVVWCPDWSVVAAAAQAGLGRSEPAAVVSGNVVEVCNGAARAAGVRRGMRRRDAQSRCPGLALLPANDERDARAFEAVLSAVEELRPGVASLRPGLLAVRAPGGWFGTEANAAATICETLVEGGVPDVRLGLADDLFTAEQAARSVGTQAWEVVPTGGSARFLAPLPIDVVAAEGAEGRDAVSLLRRLGLRTLGDLAALPGEAVEARLGRYGASVWRRSRGEDPALFAARSAPPELEEQVVFEPSLDSAEAVTFSVRTTTERFVAGLAASQLVATGVRIEVESEGVVVSARTWLHPRFFAARDLVDRVHWQLQSADVGGSLRARKESGGISAPVELVRFVPDTVEPAAAHGEALWGGGSDDRVERGVARVQAMVGFDAVRRPVRQGGRSPAARQATVTWGEKAVGLRPVERPWPGAVPGPPPVRVFAEQPLAEVVGDDGRVVAVCERGLVSSEPHRFRLARPDGTGALLPWQPVSAWAGPWPCDESWWSGGSGLTSRFQVVGADGRAWLLVCRETGWSVEAGYD